MLAGTGLVFLIRRFLRRKLPAMCKNSNKLDGKTVVITGANTGIGKEVAKELARRNARVIMACRDIQRGERAAEDIQKEVCQGQIVVRKLDLASFNSIRDFAKDVTLAEDKINILINNAGVFGPPFSLTEDGYETTFAVNHLGHFLLTNLLLEKLAASAPARIIIVSSKLYERAKMNFNNINSEEEYKGIAAYAQSKLANMLFSFELSKRLPKGITVNSLHPGFVATDLPRHMLGSSLKQLLYPIFAFLFMRTPLQGAQTVVHLATSSDVEGVSGKYFGDCKEEKIKEHALDEKSALRLWQLSEKACGLE